MMSATASLGMILQWNVDEGLSQIDKYLYSPEDYVKAGALLAVGMFQNWRNLFSNKYSFPLRYCELWCAQ